MLTCQEASVVKDTRIEVIDKQYFAINSKRIYFNFSLFLYRLCTNHVYKYMRNMCTLYQHFYTMVTGDVQYFKRF